MDSIADQTIGTAGALGIAWESLKFLALLTLSGLVSLTVVSHRKFDGVVDFALHWFGCGLVSVIATQLVLLWLGRLSYWALLVALAATLALLTLRQRSLPSIPNFANSERHLDPIAVLAVTNLAAIVLMIAVTRLASLPHSGDALAYHLPMAAQWLNRMSVLAQDARAWFYPGNAELLLTFLMLAFRADHIVAISDIAYIILLALVTLRLLTQLGLKRQTAVLCGVALAATPLFVHASGELGNDLFHAMVFLLGIYFSLRAVVSAEKSLPILLTVSCVGILCGTKYVGLPYALLLSLFTLSVWTPQVRRQAARMAPGALSLILLLGGSYYARNLLLTGNPLYPLGIKFGPLTLPAGDLSHIVATANGISSVQLANSSILARWRSPVVISSLVIGVIRYCWPILIFSLAWPILVIRSGRSLRSLGRTELALTLAWCGTLVLFLATPLSAENIPDTLNQIRSSASLRFGMISMALLLVLGAVFAPQTRATDRWLGVVALAASYTAVISMGTILFAVLIAIQLLMLIGMATPWHHRLGSGFESVRRFGRLSHGTRLTLVAGVLAMSVVGGVPAIAVRRQGLRNAAYSYDGRTEVVGWLDRQGSNRSLAVSIGIRLYPFHGPDLSNRVVALGLAQPADDWSELIETLKPDYVVVSREDGDRISPTYGQFPVQEQRLRHNRELFRMVYADSFVHVYGTSWE